MGPSAEGAGHGPPGTGWVRSEPGRSGGERSARNGASSVGCPLGRWAEGALVWFLCVPIVDTEAAAVAPFSLSPAQSLSPPLAPRFWEMLLSLGWGWGWGWPWELRACASGTGLLKVWLSSAPSPVPWLDLCKSPTPDNSKSDSLAGGWSLGICLWVGGLPTVLLSGDS